MALNYARLFAHVYDTVMANAESIVLSSKRKRLLSSLTGEILEIGSGTGSNFEFYNSKATVLAIEPSKAMLVKSEPKLKSNIRLMNAGIYDDSLEEMKFDVVVCTLVLCTIPDLNKAIEKIINLLKPQGTLIVLEHVKANSEPLKTLFNIATPIWKIIGEGCHLNRPTDECLRSSSLRLTYENYFRYKVDWYEAVYTKV